MTRFALFLALTLPAQDVWKTYPVYHPEKAPPDYIEWLRSQTPERIENPDGETLFQYPAVIGSLGHRPPSDPPYLHDKAWFDRVNPPLTREGAITGFVYILRVKGKVEIGSYSCAGCHTRVLPNGATIKGGPGNFPIDAALAEDLEASISHPALRDANKDLLRRIFKLTGDFGLGNVAQSLAGRTLGVMTPLGAAPDQPIQIPDIIGNPKCADSNYIEAKQKAYNPNFTAPSAQLIAYLSTLRAPPSPFKADKYSRQGAKVLEREGCPRCHNEDRTKAPSLKGLWYRNVLGGNGAGTSLEDWFSPARLSYLRGHEYGLQLSATDRAALIAHLRTL